MVAVGSALLGSGIPVRSSSAWPLILACNGLVHSLGRWHVWCDRGLGHALELQSSISLAKPSDERSRRLRAQLTIWSDLMADEPESPPPPERTATPGAGAPLVAGPAMSVSAPISAGRINAFFLLKGIGALIVVIVVVVILIHVL